jgi:hypothetical protein
MDKAFLIGSKVTILYSKPNLCLACKNFYDNEVLFFLLVKQFIVVCCLLVAASTGYAQEKKDTTHVAFQFSGNLNFTTNGISPIPAFSLGKPAVLVNLSLKNKKFSYDPEMAFSIEGVPWFFNNFFRYKLIEKKRFQFRTGVNWAISYTYPQVTQNGVDRTIAKGERFIWLELVPRYKISEKVAISSITFSGYNFELGSVKRINYISLLGNFTKLPLTQKLYCNIFPQLFYLNLDGRIDGWFASGVLGVGHTKLPLLVSTQVNTTLTTNLSPDPGFKWNVSLTYSF